MSELLDKLIEVEEKVKRLAGRLSDLQLENDQLRADLKRKNDVLLSKETEISNLKEHQKLLTLASSLPSTDQRKDVKLKINDMVREIDKCIALLNS